MLSIVLILVNDDNAEKHWDFHSLCLRLCVFQTTLISDVEWRRSLSFIYLSHDSYSKLIFLLNDKGLFVDLTPL